MPYVYLWVLLTGAASVESAKDDDTQHSRLDSRRGFFYYRILQFMLTLGLRWSDDFELIVRPWADKTPAPGAPTTGIYRESYIDKGDDHEEGYSFSAECQMSRTWAETCTTTNIGGNDEFGPIATFPRSTDTASDGFYYCAGYGAFNWVPVTVTAGQKYLSAAKTAIAASTEASATNDAHAAEATTADDETASTVDEDLVIVTGETSPTQTSFYQ
ncbi:uncharacterized protein B0J16DRAFT_387963 [Fusarium flagelliforme]|nr:uncharacterized protein B0J16DRAFT_387963 [Fusarium flagelliforme]KAH7174138.1 hypothetical protein B0J16DRAFT_387963 [Fusarium flagelliforme]